MSDEQRSEKRIAKSQIDYTRLSSLAFSPMLFPLTYKTFFNPVTATPLFPPLLAGGIGEVTDTIEKIKDYIEDPSEIITGPRSTGRRADTVRDWTESCKTEENSIEQDCPLKRAEIDYKYKNPIGTCDIEANVKITWQYDCCNVYDADAALTIQRNDCEDVGVIIIERYSIPETTPVQRRVCHPCTPKCLRAQISIIEYVFNMASGPGIRKKVDIDVDLCPSSNGKPRIVDNTDYSNRELDGDGNLVSGVNRQGKPKNSEGEEVTGD